MGHSTTLLLGGLAGLTIFLGLPIARSRNVSPRARGLMSTAATGILLFLLWDVLSKANEPVVEALAGVRSGDASRLATLVTLFVGGFGIGLMGLIYFNRRVGPRLAGIGRAPVKGPGAAVALATPLIPSNRPLALMIAVGMGLHNLSEGLAIGQAAAAGALAFTGVLITGFGLHNVTEGFGIAAPMTSDAEPPPWRFLGLAALAAGGPTFIGTMVGYSVSSEYAFVLCLTLAAGALVYVINEMFAVNRRMVGPALAGWGLLIGFVAAYASDLLLTAVGG